MPFAAANLVRASLAVRRGPGRPRASRRPDAPVAARAGTRARRPHAIAVFTVATALGEPSVSATIVAVQKVAISARARAPATRCSRRTSARCGGVVTTSSSIDLVISI
jgi:hypothetical protein